VWRLPIRPRRLRQWRHLTSSLGDNDQASLTFEHRSSAIVHLYDLNVTSVRDEQGARVAYVIRCLDVTERHQLSVIEKALEI
jgi:PAS domain-containing protein